MSSDAVTGYRITGPFVPHDTYGTGVQRLACGMSRLLEEPERGLAALLEIAPERRAYVSVLSYLEHLAPMYRLVYLLCETQELRSINELQSIHLGFSLMHGYLDDLVQGLNQAQLLRLTHMAQVAGLLEEPE